MKVFNSKLIGLMALFAFLAAFDPARNAYAAIPISEQPLFTQTALPPLMMMVMSRDEQLFNKAYPDFTDLDGDGQLDTTYQNAFDYSGYFDSRLCYTYSGGVFAATGPATNHQCGGTWSGNFMNWVTMSRLDVLRFVFYGGYRSTDTTTTVLERASIPNDLHAWVKVYTGADAGQYTPYAGPISFCNASMEANGTTTATSPPIMRVAGGAFTEWAGTASNQCRWREEAYSTTCVGAAGNNSCYDDAPQSAAKGSTAGFTVKVQVCGNASNRESFCQKYTNAGVDSYKPVGLLQTYGENGSMRFGLLTGSFSAPRSGGVLRRNIGLFAGNTGALNAEGCAVGDEVNTKNGRFCNQNVGASTPEGIVKTMNALKLTQWGGSVWNDCNTYGILNRAGSPHLNNPGTASGSQNCMAWGNPLSEMYAEAVRYISANGRTAGFNTGTDLAGLPSATWLDPYRSMATGGSPYCAKCSILVLSTGLNSFDSDELPAVPNLPRGAAASTQAVGALETPPISGNYLVGRIATGTPGDLALGLTTATHTDLCTSKGVADLSLVRGICPDIPSMEGSYLLDGMAYDAWITDLRPLLTSPDGTPKPATYKNTVKTFAVSLAENLPKFQIPLAGGAIKMAPLCQANNSGSADALGGANDVNWRSCFLGSVSIGPKQALASLSPRWTYGRALETDGSAGSFTWVWEDSLWGNDHDNDVVTMVTYCVGDKCNKSGSYGTYTGRDICWRTAASGNDGSPVCGTTGIPTTVGPNEALVRIENLSAYAGNAMLTGYAMTGSNADGLKRLTLRPGGTDSSILTQAVNPPASWYRPMVRRYTIGTTPARQLENPLFYAAKYGSFNDNNNNGRPDAGEWDSEVAGVPDNFFAVTNPAKLKEELQKIFQQALDDANPTASTATSTPRFVPGGTLAYQVSFNAKDWTGDVEAFELNPDGTLVNGGRPGEGVWSAKENLPAAASRNIVTSKLQSGSFVGTPFTAAGLTPAMQTTVLGPLVAPYNITDLIAYLRGDQSKEQSAAPPGPYRNRSSLIGDVLNSTPAVQGRTTFGYGRLPTTINGVPTGKDAYQPFVLAKDAIPTVYVGSNDGMLHAFDGGPNGSGGTEKFAYIPNAVLGKLNRLAVPTYSHTYFVDGTPLIGDAFNGTAWQTVLLGSTGAGARSVFALNITDPDALGAGSVMWEFNDQVDTDMGTAIVQPSLGLTEDGAWRAAIGNGFNSANNRAMLFVRDLWTGAAVAKVDTGVGTAADPNGLATATIVDTDGNGAGDTIYAGDYYGNMWKFVYSSGTWVIGTNAAGNQAPIFTAEDDLHHRQPITSGVYTVANPFGGTMVLFGTGKYLSIDDADPLHLLPDGTSLTDTIYAIWDAPPLGSTGSPCEESPELPTRANMQEQIVTADAGGYRASSQTPFDFLCTSDSAADGKMGWFIDLTFTPSGGSDLMHGERVVAAPTVILGTLLVNTFRPIGDVCVPGGENFLFELDALTGAANFSEVLPPGGGGGAPPPPAGSGTGGTLIGTGPPQGSPLPVVDIPTPPVIGPIICEPGSPDCEPIIGGAGSNDCKWTLPNPANKSIQTPIPCGRVSWRQLR
jgi:type IV pilus assembly protein PilY1